MILTIMGGRCGNQLFRYAITKKISQMYPNEDILIDYRMLEKQNTQDPSFVNTLSEFKCTKYKEFRNGKFGILCGKFNLVQIAAYYFYMIWEKYARKAYSNVLFYNKQSNLQKIMNKLGIYNLIQGDEPLHRSWFKNKYICGNYENRVYYDDIRTLLQSEIIPIQPTNGADRLLDYICQNHCVCVSVRRGDFLKYKERNVCSQEYFYNAIEYILNTVDENLTFVFFSDEPEWVRKNLKVPYKIKVLYESGEDSISNKLYMMSKCRHFILSNSTFCWWAWYLSEHFDEQIVISPSKWFDMDGFKHPLIDNSWVLLQ